jgi:hypothetical protein
MLPSCMLPLQISLSPCPSTVLCFPLCASRASAFNPPYFCGGESSGPCLRNGGLQPRVPIRVFPSLFSPFSTNSFGICTYRKSTFNSYRIRTSKIKDLKPCRMNTYKKTGRGAPPGPPSPKVSLPRYFVTSLTSLPHPSSMEQIPRSHVFTGARGKTHELHA